VAELEVRYRTGGLGDATLKRRLDQVLQVLLAPIRARRAEFAADPHEVRLLVQRGSARGREIAAAVLADVRAVFHLDRTL
jgi:tryptophanyl-tRNA synthetase